MTSTVHTHVFPSFAIEQLSIFFLSISAIFLLFLVGFAQYVIKCEAMDTKCYVRNLRVQY